ncbi:MAG: hypothetical protein JKY42_11690 [Flavobacteriales bacterium]|nr:hypothetical protein [Flavobacteriales bacterium]
MNQKAYLNKIKKELDMKWDDIAKEVNIVPRAFKTYRMPPESKDYRTMPRLAVDALERLRKEKQTA